jgi:tetratricopeptide (TPR) repeat protein
MKKFSLLLVLLIALVSISCTERKDPNTAIQDIPLENNYSDELRLKSLTDAINEHPDNPELYYQRGLYLLELSRGQEAFADAEKGLTFDGSNCQLWYLKAKAIITIPNLDKSLEAAHKAEALGCASSELLSLFGELYYIKKDYDKAMAYVNKAISIDKYDAHSYFFRGLIFKDKNDTAKAQSNFQTVIELKPEYIDAYNEMAMIKFDKSDYATGLEYLKSGLRFNSKDAFLNYNTGMYYFYKLQLDSAKTWYEKALFFEPKMYQAHFMLGKLAFDKQDYDAGLGHLTMAVQNNPQDPLINYYLAMNCEYKGLLDKAINCYSITANSDNKYRESAAKRIAILQAKGAALRADSTTKITQ